MKNVIRNKGHTSVKKTELNGVILEMFMATSSRRCHIKFQYVHVKQVF